jgi:hypothetical protein
MKHPKIVLLVFVSGKIVLTGAKMREEIYTPLRTFTQYLQSTGNVSVEIRHYAELLYSQVLLLWQLTRIPSVSISKEWNSIIMLDFAVLES